MAQAKKALAKTSRKQNGRSAPRASVKTYNNYIGGKWVPSESGEVFENINPADTRDVIGRFPLSTSDDVNAAVNAAQEAFDRWRHTPAPRRAEILFRLGEILIRNKDTFTADMTREMGKVLKEAGGDVQEAIDCTYYTAGEGRRLHGFTTPAEMPDKFAMCVRQPVGLCGLITPWNFPMAIPSWKLIPALVCGNTVVLKPAEDTPLSTYNLVKACEEAGIPPGVVNLVTGYGETAGAAMTNHPALRLISFTGSTETGRTGGLSLCRTQRDLLARDGRQERHHRHGRCRYRSGNRRSGLGRVWNVRPTLHCVVAADRPQEGLQAVFAEAGGTHRRICESAMAPIRRLTWVR